MKDNTSEFVEEMIRVAEIVTHFGGYKVYAPLINLDEDAVVRLSESLGVRWLYTYSCYAGAGWTEDGLPIYCGTCSICRRRYSLQGRREQEPVASREAASREPEGVGSSGAKCTSKLSGTASSRPNDVSQSCVSAYYRASRRTAASTEAAVQLVCTACPCPR